MNIIEVQQGTDEWLEWRKEGISASDVSTIQGLNPYKTAYVLYLEKVGLKQPDDLSNNPHVQRGNALEDSARVLFESLHDEVDFVLPLCVEDKEHPQLKASLDGLDNGVIAEFKCPGENKFGEVLALKEESSSYKLYYPQVQDQMLITKAKVGFLFFYFEDKQTNEVKYYEFKIKPDKDYQAQIKKDKLAFHKMLVNKTPPELDKKRDIFSPTSKKATNDWSSLVVKLQENQVRIDDVNENILKDLESKQAEIKKLLVALMGEYDHAEYGGLKVTRFTKQGNVSYKKVVGELLSDVDVDFDKYRGNPSTQTKFTKQKIKKALAS